MIGNGVERMPRRAPRTGLERRGKSSAAGKRRTLAMKQARAMKQGQR